MFVWYPNRVVIEKDPERRGYFDPRRFPVLTQLLRQKPDDRTRMLRAALHPDDLRAQQDAYRLPPLAI